MMNDAKQIEHFGKYSMNDLGWVDALNGEPLRLSDEQLRNELELSRNLHNPNYKRIGVPMESLYHGNDSFLIFNQPSTIYDLELVFDPPLDPEFWSSLLKMEMFLYNIDNSAIGLHIMSNIVLCRLLGRTIYQDPNGTCHLPLYCYKTTYYKMCLFPIKDLPKYHLEWRESPFIQKSSLSIHLDEVRLTQHNGIWIDHLPEWAMMYLFIFD